MVSGLPPPLASLLTGLLEEVAPQRRLPVALPGRAAPLEPRRIVALGKAGRAMARAAASLWPSASGFLYEVEGPGPIPCGWVALSGSHPLPSPANADATVRLSSWLAEGEGPLLALISGGTSSLLVDPVPPWTLEDKLRLCSRLLGAGAPIADVNAVRMRLSRVKGGGLRRRIAGGPVLTGVWCDVAPADFRLVGSAPTLALPKPPRPAEAILARLGVSPLRPLPPDRTLRRTPSGDRRVLLASGRDLALAAARGLRGHGYDARVVHLAEGTDAGLLAARLRHLAEGAARGRHAWVLSGEVTSLAGGGRGGRCSHLAALVALELAALRGWTFVAFATDGADGCGDGGAWTKWDALPPIPEISRSIGGGDTASLWASHGTGLPRRPTGNNLRDLYLLLVER